MNYNETEEFKAMLASGMSERTAYRKIKALYDVQRKTRQSQKQEQVPYIVNKGELV